MILKWLKQIWAQINQFWLQAKTVYSEIFSSAIPKEQDFQYEKVEDVKIFGLLGRIILWSAFMFIIVMLVWAGNAVLDEVTVAQGKVIPSSKTQIIQNLEGGIAEKVLVKEGQMVEKNQIIARLNNIKFSSNYREGKIKEAAFRIKLARLEAETSDKAFKISKEMEKGFPELVTSEKELYQSRKNELETLDTARELASKEIEMTKPLLKSGSISKVEILRLQQRLNEIDSNIGKFRSGSLQELNAARAEISRLHEDNLALQDQLRRTAVRSPVRGIVKQIYVSTAGGVLTPGMPLLEIVPIDDTLLIEANVNPKDIGFLHPAQDAMVKITAYDFSIYGGLPGKVEHISADTTTDQRGNSYYEIWVRTNKNFLEKKDKKLQIIPGMQASVDILTGHKSILDYILKPILKARQQALRER